MVKRNGKSLSMLCIDTCPTSKLYSVLEVLAVLRCIHLSQSLHKPPPCLLSYRETIDREGSSEARKLPGAGFRFVHITIKHSTRLNYSTYNP